MNSKQTLLTCALLVGGSGALALAGVPGPGSTATAAEARFEDTFESLSAAYDKAVTDYRTALKAADREERRALRKNSPIKEYWPKFEALGRKNDGQSLLWMTNNVSKYRGIKKKDRVAALTPMFDALFEHHTDAEWFGGAFASLAKQSSKLDSKMVKELFDKGIKGASSDEMKAEGLFHGINAFAKSDDRAIAEAYFERLKADFPESEFVAQAKRAMIRPEDSGVGRVAPDFKGKTIDGFEFNLEDYRGKVVLLDFYGFW